MTSAKNRLSTADVTNDNDVTEAKNMQDSS